MLQALGRCQLQQILKLATQLLGFDLKHQCYWSQGELHQRALHPSASARIPSSSAAFHLRQKLKPVTEMQQHENNAAQEQKSMQISSLKLSSQQAKAYGFQHWMLDRLRHSW